MAQKVIFQEATVKGSLCVLKSLPQHLTMLDSEAEKGKNKWKERLKEKSTQCTKWEEGIFW